MRRFGTSPLRVATLALLIIAARACEHLLLLDNHRADFLAAQRTTWMQWAFADRSFSRECLVVFAPANGSVAPGHRANATGLSTVALPQFGRDTWRRREWMLSWAIRAHGGRLATVTLTEGDVFICWRSWRELVRGVAVAAAAAAAAPIVVGYRHRDGRLFDMHFTVLSSGVAAALAAALGDRARRRAATRDRQYAVPPGQLGACASACVARARARLCDVRASGLGCHLGCFGAARRRRSPARDNRTASCAAPLVYAHHTRDPGDLHRAWAQNRDVIVEPTGSATAPRLFASLACEDESPELRALPCGRFHRGCAR